jgi:hypothetical protein
MAAPRAAASSLQRHISGGGGKRGAAQLLRPAPPEVRAVVDALAALHGRPNRHDHAAGLQPGCELKEPHTVLDSLVRAAVGGARVCVCGCVCGSCSSCSERARVRALPTLVCLCARRTPRTPAQVRTILSQNTTDVTSQRAYTSLKQLFPAWEQVRTAPAGEEPGVRWCCHPQRGRCARPMLRPAGSLRVGHARLSADGARARAAAVAAGAVEQAIRVGGLADIKAGRIKVCVCVCLCLQAQQAWLVPGTCAALCAAALHAPHAP